MHSQQSVFSLLISDWVEGDHDAGGVLVLYVMGYDSESFKLLVVVLLLEGGPSIIISLGFWCLLFFSL